MTVFSYQLYSSRNFGPLSDTLRMVSELGYGQVEGYGALFADLADPAVLRADLDANGLQMATAHISLEMVRDTPEKVIDIARALKIESVFVPYLDAPARPTDAAGWASFGKALAEAGKPLQDAGLGFGWHNHDFEFLGDGPLPIKQILAASDDLALEFDVAWCVRAGLDPMPWIRRYGDRITAAHLKDIAPEGKCLDEDGWADFGTGVMDWSKLLANLQANGTQYFVAEHDNPSDDRRFAKASIAAAEGFSTKGSRT